LIVGPNVRADDDKALKDEALKLNTVVIVGATQAEQTKFIDEQVAALAKDKEHAKKLLATAATTAKEKDQPFNFTGSFLLGALARELKDVDAAKLFLTIAVDKAKKLQSGSKLAMTYLELMDLLFENKKFDEVEKICKEFLEMRGGREVASGQVMALRRMIQATALMGKTEDAFKLLAPFVKAAPDDPAVQEMNGWLLRYVGKYDEAAKAYEAVLGNVESDDLKDYVRYLLSNLYSEVGDVDKATGHLKSLLEKKPDNATYNNDLGYIWADHDRNLDEAEKMIKKALDKEPKNPAYLDSMGWVMFKMKKHKEAKEYLQQAIRDPEGQHAEIFDHLGDIHKALGEKDDAVSAWKKAIDVSGTSKRDQKRKAEIEKKLKESQ
jgi:tetratricopeptide (TPR) repeat protein